MEEQERFWWLYAAGEDGACAFKIEGDPSAFADMLLEAAAWARAAMHDESIPAAVRRGIAMLPFNSVHAAPLSIDPAVYADFRFAPELEGRPFSCMGTSLLTQEEGERWFGLRDGSEAHVRDAFMYLKAGESLQALLRLDEGWLLAEAGVHEFTDRLERLEGSRNFGTGKSNV